MRNEVFYKIVRRKILEMFVTMFMIAPITFSNTQIPFCHQISKLNGNLRFLTKLYRSSSICFDVMAKQNLQSLMLKGNFVLLLSLQKTINLNVTFLLLKYSPHSPHTLMVLKQFSIC